MVQGVRSVLLKFYFYNKNVSVTNQKNLNEILELFFLINQPLKKNVSKQ